MNYVTDSLSVLRVVYDSVENKKTLKTNLSFHDIQKELPNFSVDEIKLLVEYLAGSYYLEYNNHLIFHEVCMTPLGIDFYKENFK